ncbi:MAG: type pilus assembly protein PilA [Micromonosporaceae bacterium]|nr:type pilus assembly protein PilA [Micromonosporaceae bacterium]MDT5037244.1 type pilus assembly protein PilA [Micromonosporaceae bacterium]
MLARPRRTVRNDNGFTVTELMVVTSILGVLTGIGGLAAGDITERGHATACEAAKQSVKAAAAAYFVDHHSTRAASIDELVGAELLSGQPTTDWYTIAYDGTTGVVTASGACT